MKTMDAKAWLQMEALFEVTKEDKPIIIDQSRLLAMLEGYAEYRVKLYSISDVVLSEERAELCQSFVVDTRTSSATKCANCQKEAWEHRHN